MKTTSMRGPRSSPGARNSGATKTSKRSRPSRIERPGSCSQKRRRTRHDLGVKLGCNCNLPPCYFYPASGWGMLRFAAWPPQPRSSHTIRGRSDGHLGCRAPPIGQDENNAPIEVAVLVGSALVVTACASTQYNSTWKAPGAAPLSFKGRKVAALVISKEEDARYEAESALAREITARGAIGIPAFNLIPKEIVRDKEKAKEFLEKANVAGVVAMRVVGSTRRSPEASAATTRGRTTRRSGVRAITGRGWSGTADTGYLMRRTAPSPWRRSSSAWSRTSSCSAGAKARTPPRSARSSRSSRRGQQRRRRSKASSSSWPWAGRAWRARRVGTRRGKGSRRRARVPGASGGPI